jgi:hypothetical protein
LREERSRSWREERSRTSSGEHRTAAYRLPAAMRSALVKKLALAGAAACLAASAAGCGDKKEQGVKEASPEGIALNVGGVDYNVFITRELNLAIPPDKAYYKGPPAGPGQTLYGVFLQACNQSKQTHQTIREFKVKDNQGQQFKPVPLAADNAFAYTPRKLAPKQCIPEAGSVAQQGPTAGSMLLFKFPLAVTANRPLELEIEGPYNLLKSKREVKTVELDL